MGFFGDLWSGIKNVGSKVWGGLRSGLHTIVGIGNKIRSGLQTGWDFVKKIPVIGNLAQAAVKIPIPYFGDKSLDDLASIGKTALDVGNVADKVINGQGMRMRGGDAPKRPMPVPRGMSGGSWITDTITNQKNNKYGYTDVTDWTGKKVRVPTINGHPTIQF